MRKSESPGVIERLIENWLTNTSERGYEVPFCQLLMIEGHTIVHLDRHTGTEQGKDVISRDDGGDLCAFQLKTGDINVRRWRTEVEPEINELIEYPVEHPAATGFAKPFFVTTGRLNGNVNTRIISKNNGNLKRGFASLRIWDGNELLKRFIGSHGQFLPRTPVDFHAFLHLYLADGSDVLPKDRLAQFLDSSLKPEALKTSAEAARAIASTIILVAYALGGYQRKHNHFAQFEAWLLTTSYIARLAETKGLAKKYWGGSIALALDAARRSLEKLSREAIPRESLAEGNVIVDGGPVYRARATILVGSLAAYSLTSSPEVCNQDDRRAVNAFISTHRQHMWLWGESAIPFYVLLALHLEDYGRSSEAEAVVLEIIHKITESNVRGSTSLLAAPYYDAEACMAAECELEAPPTSSDCPAGSSYTLHALIDFLVRRRRRTALARLWTPITGIQLTEMQYPSPPLFYEWRTERGRCEKRFVDRPQSWATLVDGVESTPVDSIPQFLGEHLDFAVMFMLVYPHRLCPSMLATVERLLDNESRAR